jgi:hypothetical protein
MALRIMQIPPPRTMPRSTSPSPKEEHFKQRTPKKGRDIGNDIFCKFCKLVLT